MKNNLLVTLADKNYIKQAKQLFSSVYHNAGWKGDYMLLSHQIPEKGLSWFKDKGILIKECKPVSKKGWGRWPPVLLDKFYLFTPEFKKWKNIIYLDADIIVKASLDNLTKITDFGASPILPFTNSTNKLIGKFKKPKSMKKKIFKNILRGLKRNYKLNKQLFNGGVIAFNTEIIKKDTFFKLKRLLKKYQGIIKDNEETIFNLYFNKKQERLPQVYNIHVNYSFPWYGIKPKNIKGIILHFVNKPNKINDKPWFPRNPFYEEWKKNLDKAEEINLKKIIPAEEWSCEKIKNYCWYLKVRRIISKIKYLFLKLLKPKTISLNAKISITLFLDRKLGEMGLFFKKNYPKLYPKLKDSILNKRIFKNLNKGVKKNKSENKKKTPQTEKPYQAWLQWELTEVCNLNCKYCFYRNLPRNKRVKKIKINPLLKTLKKNQKKFLITFTGGEPFLVSNLIETSIKLTENHYISLNTNLVSDKIKRFGRQIDPSKVELILASFHPEQLKKYNLFQKYIDNFLFLKKKGFKIISEAVAHPSFLSKARKYKKILRKKGISLSFARIYQGEYNRKSYPQSYTKKQLKIFGQNKKEIKKYYQRGKTCNAGYNAGVVFPNGDIWPCYHIKQKIGNIYKEIKFKKKLTTCPVKFCTCPLKEYNNNLFKKSLKEKL